MVNIQINDKPVTANKGETILEAAKKIGIKIPTLCYMKDMFPTGACRLCLVEIEGKNELVTSCSYPVEEGLKIKTHSNRVVEARKTIVELLLSNHPDDCLYCERNKNCELQSLTEELHINERRVFGKKNTYKMDLSSISITRDPAKCILCGRCVRVCEEIQGVSCIDFIGRGNKTIVGTVFNEGLNVSSCINCGQCIMVCPTGALTENNNMQGILDTFKENHKYMVVQYAPAITVSIAEEFGLKPGQDVNGLLNAALRKMGFNKVFDTSFTADLTIMEESAELINRVSKGGVLPMFTSCCPGWIKYVEEFHFDLLPNISTCKSPQQMMGAVIKNYFSKVANLKKEDIFSVSIMPCTAKKFEAGRGEMSNHGIPDVDMVLTTRELVKLIKLYGIDLNSLEPEMADDPMGRRSTAGKIFAASGGVMEAALRTAYFKLTGEELENFRIEAVRGFDGIKEAKIKVGDLTVGAAVVSGLKNAKKLIEQIKNGKNDIHFIEVMACPGGCIAGGGQPIPNKESNIKARLKTLYEIDDKEMIKQSHNNPDIKQLYKQFLGEPLGHMSHELLHTCYIERSLLK